MSLPIPNRFKLLGQTIEVKYNPKLLTENDFQGAASYRRNEIEIMPDSEANPRRQDQIEHTFCHELMHHILFYAGCTYRGNNPDNMHQDERFVDTVAGLLHQALTTQEFD